MGWRIGIDSGGTFTDICLFDDVTGRLDVWKIPSTPDDPSRSIATGVVEALTRAGTSMADVSFLGHGTTVATNALIEGKGAKTAVLTTDGFRDLLEIGRQKRPSLYDMMADKPPVLVPRDLRREVPERIRHDGTVETPLDTQRTEQVVRDLAASDIEALAICFLYGFLNPEHEAKAQAIAEAHLGTAFVCVSQAVAPEFREFERLSTTVVNAYLGPTMGRYIKRLDDRLQTLGLRPAPHLTQSNGGVIGFETAAATPVRTLLSGPSTGVVAARAISAAAGYRNVITFDVGGTSSDVALLEGGVCKRTGQADVHGYPIKAPMLDIHTVGAGGGSIAYVDSGGLLKVGPQSAGADPGPVCYDRGGTEPTVTDANVVLQTLNPSVILGGRMPVHRDRAFGAIEGLARRLGLGVMETAQGIVAVATANMAKAIRVISVQRGHDPRDYALMAFGGGGPLHAARLAQELDIAEVIVPPTPGTLCALGLLLTDLQTDFAVSRLMLLTDTALGSLSDGFAALDVQAGAWFAAEGIAEDRRRLHRSVDLRYAGQNYELEVPVPGNAITPATLNALAGGFAAAHEQRFGFVAEGEAIELVSLRVSAVGVVEKARIAQAARPATDSPSPIDERNAWLPEAGGLVPCPVFARADLACGHRVRGPAIVEQMDATTLILPAMQARVDAYENLILATAS